MIFCRSITIMLTEFLLGEVGTIRGNSLRDKISMNTRSMKLHSGFSMNWALKAQNKENPTLGNLNYKSLQKVGILKAPANRKKLHHKNFQNFHQKLFHQKRLHINWKTFQITRHTSKFSNKLKTHQNNPQIFIFFKSIYHK